MFRFLPWKFIVQRAARAYGFADPALWLARIRKFAQPSEVQEPIELVRAGVLFHARGIVNAKAIQHNLDWVWPYWVERQFDPDDISFIPRSFSFSHINLTHRNWTAIGLPELPIYPIVDPRGLVTPRAGRLVDRFLAARSGRQWRSCRAARTRMPASKSSRSTTGCRSSTTSRHGDLALAQSAGQCAGWAPRVGDRRAGVESRRAARSCWPFVRTIPRACSLSIEIRARKNGDGWCVNEQVGSHHRSAGRSTALCPTMQTATCSIGCAVRCGRPTDVNGSTHVRCTHRHGDGRLDLSIQWPAGRPHGPRAAGQRTCGSGRNAASSIRPSPGRRFVPRWRACRSRTSDCSSCTMRPCRRSLLLSADEMVPGPYTYRRFWFRDACLMMNAMLAIGLTDRARRAIEHFPRAATAQRLFPLAGRRVGLQRPGAVDHRPLRRS